MPREIADGVLQVAFGPSDALNAYLVADVLIDAAIPPLAPLVVRAVRGRAVRAHALTHAHPDHAGGSARVCAELGVPFWVSEGDAGAAVSGVPVAPPGGRLRPVLERRYWKGQPVDRQLREGDEIAAGWRVVELPGHSPGQIGFFRDADRVLIAGDVVMNLDVRRLRPRLRLPLGAVTVDSERNAASVRRVADLEPSLVALGHGPPLREPAERLRALLTS